MAKLKAEKTEAKPKPALKKRDVKAESKAPKSKGVKFSENIEVHTYYERSWNDFKRKDFTKGAFTQTEVDTLIKSLCDYAAT